MLAALRAATRSCASTTCPDTTTSSTRSPTRRRRDLVDALVERARRLSRPPSRSASSLLRDNEEDMARLEVVEAGRLNAAASKVQAMHRGSIARQATQKALIDGDVHAADAYVGAKRGAQRRTAAAAEARRDALERAGLTAGGGGRSHPTAAAAPATSEELASFRRAGGSDGGDFLSRLAALEAKYETYDAAPPADASTPAPRTAPPTLASVDASTRAAAAAANRAEAAAAQLAAASGGGTAAAAALSSSEAAEAGSPLRMALLEVQIIAGRDLVAMDANLFGADSSDPYAEITLGGEVLARTHVVVHSLSPTWDASFRLELPPSRVEHELANSADLVLALWDRDLVGRDDPLGEVRLPLRTLIGAPPAPRWHAVVGDGRISRNARASGELYVAATLALRRAAAAAAAAGDDVDTVVAPTVTPPSSDERTVHGSQISPEVARRPSTDLLGAAAEALRGANSLEEAQAALSLASPCRGAAAPPAADHRPTDVAAARRRAAVGREGAVSEHEPASGLWRRAEGGLAGVGLLWRVAAAQCDADAPAPGDSRGEGDEGAAVGRRRRPGRPDAGVRRARRLPSRPRVCPRGRPPARLPAAAARPPRRRRAPHPRRR